MIKDILSGMWVMSSSVKDQLNLTMGDWNMSPEIKLNAIMNPAIAFQEHHIRQHLRHGQSHQSHWKTGLSHLTWIAVHRVKTVFANRGEPQLQANDFEDA